MVKSSKTDSKKIQKKLLIILPIVVVVIALAIFLGCFFGCQEKNNESNDSLTSRTIPITDEYYKFNDQGEVLGWSDKVIENYDQGDKTMLTNFDTMSLQGKTIAGDCSFQKDGADVMSIYWNPEHLDLSHTTWQYKYDESEGTYKSGDCTFSDYILAGVVSIDLSNADFAPPPPTTNPSMIKTASRTFAYECFSELRSLNLTSTNFSPSGIENCTIYTADETFAFCFFTNLQELSLNSTIFANDEMATFESTSLADSYYSINTANNTFAGCEFDQLDRLNLEGQYFTDNMVTKTSSDQIIIYPFRSTFSGSEFFSEDFFLDLSSVRFSSYYGEKQDNNLIFIPAYNAFERVVIQTNQINLTGLETFQLVESESDEIPATNKRANAISGNCFGFENFTYPSPQEMNIIDRTVPVYWGQEADDNISSVILNSWFHVNGWTINE